MFFLRVLFSPAIFFLSLSVTLPLRGPTCSIWLSLTPTPVPAIYQKSS